MEKVEVPAREYIHHELQGSLPGIAKMVGKMYDWAKQQEVETGEFKIDYGYRPEGTESSHDLYIKVER